MTYEEMESLKKGNRLMVRNNHTNYKWEPGTVTSAGTLAGSPSLWIAFDKRPDISVNIPTGMQFKKEYWDNSTSAERFKSTQIQEFFFDHIELSPEVEEFAKTLIGMDIREADKKLSQRMKEIEKTDLSRRNLYCELSRYFSSHGYWGFDAGDEVDLVVSDRKVKRTKVQTIEDNGLVVFSHISVSPNLVKPLNHKLEEATTVKTNVEQLSLF